MFKGIFISFILTFHILYAQNIQVTQSWQLLGATENIYVSDFDNKCVDFIWKYDNKWKLHIANSNNYNLPNTIKKFDTINKGQGFWIKGNRNCYIDTTIDSNTSGTKKITQLIIPKSDLPAGCTAPKRVNIWSAIMEDYRAGTGGTHVDSIDSWDINENAIVKNGNNYIVTFPKSINTENSYTISRQGSASTYTEYRNVHATVYCFNDRNSTWDDAGNQVISYHLKSLGKFQKQSVDVATVFIRQYDSDIDHLPGEINGGFEPNRLVLGVSTSIPMISHWPIDNNTNVKQYGMIVSYKDTNVFNGGEVRYGKYLIYEYQNNNYYQNHQSKMYRWEYDGHNGFIAAPYRPANEQTQFHFVIPSIVLQNKNVIFGDLIKNQDFEEAPDVKFEWGENNYPTWIISR